MELAKRIFLAVWTIFFFIGIIKNFAHYGIANRITIILITIAPYIIMYIIKERKKNKPKECNDIKKYAKINIANVDSEDLSASNSIAELYKPVENYDFPYDSIVKVNTKYVEHDYPKEVLVSMRSAYSQMQAQNDIRILNESIDILKYTESLETFFSRYELAMSKSFTLDQAKAAGIHINTSITPQDVVSLRKRIEHILMREYNNELKKIATLKTPNGKLNRIDKFISFLSQYYYEFDFEFPDAYRSVIDELNSLKNELYSD